MGNPLPSRSELRAAIAEAAGGAPGLGLRLRGLLGRLAERLLERFAEAILSASRELEERQ